MFVMTCTFMPRWARAEPTLRAAVSSTRWLMVPGRQQEAASLAPRRPRSRVARFLSQPDRDDP